MVLEMNLKRMVKLLHGVGFCYTATGENHSILSGVLRCKALCGVFGKLAPLRSEVAWGRRGILLSVFCKKGRSPTSAFTYRRKILFFNRAYVRSYLHCLRAIGNATG